MKKNLTVLLVIASAVAMTSCASVSVPLGENAKYGTIVVGYQPPKNLPYGIEVPATLRDK